MCIRDRFYGFGKTRYSSTLKYEKGSFVKVRDVTPVSYTHLDVYKRQHQKRTG